MSNDSNVRLKAIIAKLETKLTQANEDRAVLKIELDDIENLLERHQLISEFAHNWEMWYNPDGTIEYVSPSFKDITGYAPMELLSNIKLIDSIIFAEDFEIFSTFIADSINFTKLKQALRFRILTRTKQLRWCEIKSRAVYNKRGKYLGQRVSVNDITSLMHALGQIKNLSDSKQYEVITRQKYRKELESKERELIGLLMEISQKNETMQYAKQQLVKLSERLSNDKKELLNEVIKHIQSSLNSTGDWENLKRYFEQLNPGFFSRLKQKAPGLSARDLKICSYLKLGLSTKEIAALQNITLKSAEISRVRLRKKLGLTREIGLADYISNI